MDRFKVYWVFKCTIGDANYPLKMIFNRPEKIWILEQIGDMFKTHTGNIVFEDGNLVCKNVDDVILTFYGLNFLTVENNDSGDGTALNNKVHMQWQYAQTENDL